MRGMVGGDGRGKRHGGERGREGKGAGVLFGERRLMP